MSTFRVLISGAGIAGLSLARRFEQLGIEHVILEKRSASYHSGAGIALPFNAIQALRELGLEGPVLEAAHHVQEVIYKKKSGRLLGRASLLEPPLNRDNFVAMRRDRLHEILLDGVKGRIHFETSIEAFDAQPDRVRVTTSNAALNGFYDMVVSAEGINSTLRKLCFPDEKTTVDHGMPTWRFVVECPNHNMQPTYMFGRSEMFMAYPLGPNTVYCYCHVYDEVGKYDLGSSRDHLIQLFGEFSAEVTKLLACLKQQPIVRGHLESVVKPYFSKGRVVFVGDAGHACTPLLQQGAASAFEDIICLAEQLEGLGIVEAIDAYQRLRQPRVEWVMKNSDNPIKMVKMTRNPFGSFFRNSIIRAKGPLNAAGWRQLAVQGTL